MITEVKNKKIPESLKKEIDQVLKRLLELQNILLWLRAYPGDKDATIDARQKLRRLMHKATEGLLLMEKYENTGNSELTERGFMNELRDHCKDLWKEPVGFNENEVVRININKDLYQE